MFLDNHKNGIYVELLDLSLVTFSLGTYVWCNSQGMCEKR